MNLPKDMSKMNRTRAKLLVYFGMTAAGKSYLAGKWAEKNDCPYHNTDVVRKELAGITSDCRQHTGVEQGIYSKEFTRRTYDELIQRAQTDFDTSEAAVVVLDGSYGSEVERCNVVAALCSRADIYFIYCYCNEQIVKHRLKQRAEDPNAISDGRWEIYLMQKKGFSVPVTVDGAMLLSLDTDGPVNVLIREITDFIS